MSRNPTRGPISRAKGGMVGCGYKKGGLVKSANSAEEKALKTGGDLTKRNANGEVPRPSKMSMLLDSQK